MRVKSSPSSIELSATLRFVISCLQEDVPQTRQLLPAVDWSLFVDMMHRHRIGPILSRKIQILDLVIPKDVSDHLKQLYQKNIILTLAHTHVIHRLSQLFDKAGIEFMVLKGFSNRAGYENLADRHINDLDILLRSESQIWPAIDLLQASGFELENWDPLSWNYPQKKEYLRRAKDISLTDSGTGVHIELHFRLFSQSVVGTLGNAELWSDSALMDVDGVQVVVPNEVRHLQYLVLHGCGCAWFRLKWIADVYFMLCGQSSEDVLTLVDSAKRGGWLRPLLLTLSILQHLFSLRLPDNVVQLMAADGALQSMQEEVLISLSDLPPSERVHLSVRSRGQALVRRLKYEMTMRTGLSTKWHFFSGHGFSPANWQVLPLPASLHFLYKGLHPLIHLFRVLSSR